MNRTLEIGDRKEYLDYIYTVVKLESSGMDAIYKDYIIELVGKFGFSALYVNRLLEPCGSVNARELYVLLDKK